jgi:cob(I)alamin adenosyltransferase
MEKSKIYTRTGDEGYTSLVGGKRVFKTHPRLEAYGTVDELNAAVACLLETIDDRDDRALLQGVQNTLFDLGAYLATEGIGDCRLSPAEIERLERAMDEIDETLPPVRAFILPGGCKGNAWAHICRTIARRAERCIYRIAEQEDVDAAALKYINRLSDYFFLLGRKQNFVHHISENIWK